MADSRISQLPELTSPLASDVFPIVNSNETKKITLQTINNNLPITSFVSSESGSWIGGGTSTPDLSSNIFIATWSTSYRNMQNNTLNLVNFNNIITNTDPDNYILETGNTLENNDPDNSINGKIQIKQPGNYLINLLYNSYDINAGAYYSFYIYTNLISKSSSSSHYSTIYETNLQGNGSGQRVMFESTGLIRINSTPTWVSIVFRPTSGNPYPADVSEGSIASMPPRIEIVKI
jgi:hypothetical protein